MSDLLNKASLVMIPSGYKEDVVYSAIPSDGSGDLSFTRASNGTRINSAGLVEVCPWNLLEYSEDLSNVYWQKNLVTINSNTTVAPNGTTTADTLTNSSTGYGIYAVLDVIPSQQYTFSFYIKKGTNTSYKLSVIDASTFTSIASLDYSADVSATDWVRITQTFTTPSGTTSIRVYQMRDGSTTGTAFLWGAQLNIGSTAKPYFPTTDRLNVPRLTYQNGGGGCPSLLLEKQSTNSQTYSEQIDNAAWGLSNLSVTANNTTSPDGTQNADKIVENTANSRHEFYGVSLAFNGNNAISFYAKNAGRRYLCALEPTGAGGATFDLQNGVVSAVTAVSANIESVGDGWYRCSVIISKTATTQIYYCLRTTGSVGIETYTGDGTSGVYFWGAQTELNSSYPTSYIPTTSASATRVADTAQKTGISSLIGQTEGTIFWNVSNFTQYSNDGARFFVYADANNFILISPYGTTLRVLIVSSGTAFDNFMTISGDSLKIAVAYKANDYKFYVNGNSIGTPSVTSVPAMSAIGIFNDFGVPVSSQSETKELILFPTRLTNAELTSLTTI